MKPAFASFVSSKQELHETLLKNIKMNNKNNNNKKIPPLTKLKPTQSKESKQCELVLPSKNRS